MCKQVQGSVTNIIDNSDTVAKSYTYDAYGNTSSTGTFINSFAYTGAVIDPETGLYYMNARYYEPGTGRFISEDTYRGEGEAFWHLYLYCNGDPINNTDPTGNTMAPGGRGYSGDYKSNKFYVSTHIPWYVWLISPGAAAAGSRASFILRFDYKWDYKHANFFGLRVPIGKKIAGVDRESIATYARGLTFATFHKEKLRSCKYTDDYVSIKIEGSWCIGGSYYIEGIFPWDGTLTFKVYPFNDKKTKVWSS